MALTPFQRHVCRLLAEQRRRSGESYVAGGVALNELLSGDRRSRDIDPSHDTAEALAESWARDWVDTLRCHAALQPLGYLAWAAAAKDPGWGPMAILEEAARSARYRQPEIDRLDFDGPPPRAADLSAQWHRALAEAREIVGLLPAEQAGRCVLDHRAALLRAGPSGLASALARHRVRFHEGRIRGAFPELREDGAR